MKGRGSYFKDLQRNLVENQQDLEEAGLWKILGAPEPFRSDSAPLPLVTS